MIRVNLARGFQGAGSKTTVGLELESKAADIQRQGATRLLMIMIFPLSLYAYEFVSIPEMRTRLLQKRSQLSEMKTKNESAKLAMEEIKKYREDQDNLQKKIASIDSLRKDRMLETKLLDALQSVIPEKVWLTRLEIIDKKINISGLSTTDSELSLFMEGLNRIPVLSEVSLIRSAESNSSGAVLKRFDLTCVVNRD